MIGVGGIVDGRGAGAMKEARSSSSIGNNRHRVNLVRDGNLPAPRTRLHSNRLDRIIVLRGENIMDLPLIASCHDSFVSDRILCRSVIEMLLHAWCDVKTCDRICVISLLTHKPFQYGFPVKFCSISTEHYQLSSFCKQNLHNYWPLMSEVYVNKHFYSSLSDV
mmetsp:Transcript_3999/g.10117  ORF Transcript_3999/g.10117 Transcript_3999/m.10117 type:complete len:164 (-) Transcript_3999:113-604(-)